MLELRVVISADGIDRLNSLLVYSTTAGNNYHPGCKMILNDQLFYDLKYLKSDAGGDSVPDLARMMPHYLDCMGSPSAAVMIQIIRQ